MFKSRNFGWVHSVDWKEPAHIIEETVGIEKLVQEKEYKIAANKTRSLTEDILVTELNVSGIGLQEMIKSLSSLYHVESDIYHALNVIKVKGNEGSHGRFSSRKPNQDDLTLSESIYILKSLWKIMKWIATTKEYIQIEDILPWTDDSYINNPSLIESIDPDMSNSSRELEVNLIPIYQLITNGKFKFSVPLYQREYTWSKDTLKVFLDDILDRSHDEKVHYLGSIAAANAGDEIYKIIDGQQRITSSMLVIRAAIERYMDNDLEMPESLEKMQGQLGKIYNNMDVTSGQKETKQILTFGSSQNDSVAKENYDFICEFISELSVDEFKDFVNSFIMNMKVSFLDFNISLPNEMDIFEKMNSTGTSLTNWDLIKNYLFTKFKWPNERDSNIENMLLKTINNQIWFAIKIAKMDAGDKSPEDSSIQTIINNFMATYLRYAFQKDLNKPFKGKSKVYDNFKELFDWKYKSLFEDPQKWNKMVESLGSFIKIYSEITIRYKSINSKLNKFENYLNITNKDDLLPIYYLMNQVGEIKIKDGTVLPGPNFEKYITILEKYYVRINVATYFDKSQTQAIDKFVMDNIDEISTKKLLLKLEEFFHSDKLDPAMPTFEDFETALYTQNKIRPTFMRNMLIKLEMSLSSHDDGVKLINQQYEHILAQRLPFKNYSDKSIDEVEYKELKTKYVDSLGNATILYMKKNQKAGNRPFDDKLNKVYNTDPLTINSGDYDFAITKFSDFTYEDVPKRGKMLAEVIANLYK